MLIINNSRIFGTFKSAEPNVEIVYGLVDQPQFWNPLKHQVLTRYLFGSQTLHFRYFITVNFGRRRHPWTTGGTSAEHSGRAPAGARAGAGWGTPARWRRCRCAPSMRWCCTVLYCTVLHCTVQVAVSGLLHAYTLPHFALAFLLAITVDTQVKVREN